ncbi:MAG: lysophospholipid acyltransferase family protein [Pseudomonadota bacterium]
MPRGPLARLRDIAFHLALYVLMGVMGVLGAPLLVSHRATHGWMRLYARSVLWLARMMAGIRVEIRGRMPTEPVVVAAKHQSLLDVYILFAHLPHARFVMKRSLTRMPVFGLYTRRIGTVAVDRGKRGEGARMVGEMAAAQVRGGQIVVYPQGTRVAPGATAPYKRGVVMLARELALPVVPAATNTGLFWVKGGRLAGPGTAVMEFLAPLPAPADPELDDRLLEALERQIEGASNRLAAPKRAR